MVKKVLLVLAIVGLGAWAQEAATQKSAPASAANEQEKFYRLTFVVRELENERVINSRGYFVIASTGSFERSSLRAGQDVPVGTSMQWHQFEAGISIDTTRLKEVGDRVALHIVTEVRSLIERPRDENGPPQSAPIVRNNRWESSVVLPLNQPTIVYSSDDPASKRKMQLQVTVVPVK